MNTPLIPTFSIYCRVTPHESGVSGTQNDRPFYFSSTPFLGSRMFAFGVVTVMVIAFSLDTGLNDALSQPERSHIFPFTYGHLA